MTRRATVLGLITFALALLVLPGSPADGGDKGNPKKPAAAQADGNPVMNVARIREVRALLNEPMDMRDFQTPMTLKEALGLIQDKLEAAGRPLPILVNEEAFKVADPDAPDVYDTQIKFPPFPRRIPLATVLRIMLRRIPNANATYLIRDGILEVTTEKEATAQKILRQRVVAAFDRRPLGEALEALADQAGLSVAVDPREGAKLKTPVTVAFGNDVRLEAALRILADMADLKLVLVDDAVYFTSPAHAEKLEKERRARDDDRRRDKKAEAMPPAKKE